MNCNGKISYGSGIYLPWNIYIMNCSENRSYRSGIHLPCNIYIMNCSGSISCRSGEHLPWNMYFNRSWTAVGIDDMSEVYDLVVGVTFGRFQSQVSRLNLCGSTSVLVKRHSRWTQNHDPVLEIDLESQMAYPRATTTIWSLETKHPHLGGVREECY